MTRIAHGGQVLSRELKQGGVMECDKVTALSRVAEDSQGDILAETQVARSVQPCEDYREHPGQGDSSGKGPKVATGVTCGGTGRRYEKEDRLGVSRCSVLSQLCHSEPVPSAVVSFLENSVLVSY